MDSEDSDHLIRDTEAAALLSCSKATFWRRVSDGTVPRPLKIGRTTRWLRKDVTAVIERAKVERDRSAARR
jgi:predicted DNA-binding transcriptional regulator AlpA